MSIYGTLWHLNFPDPSDLEPFGVTVYAQAVPAHIDYDGEGWEFLPPPVPDTGEAYNFRAVVLCAPWTTKGTARNGQEYVNPLLTLTGAEYRAATWIELHDRILALLEGGAP